MKKDGKNGRNYPTVYCYIAVLSIFNFLAWSTPVLSILDNPISDPLYSFFSLFCHQMFERSMCLSSEFQIGDCELSSGFTHQFPVCSRDMSFYFAMLIGGMAYLAIGKKDEIEIPPISVLVLFILPLAIDGTTQLFGLRESSNFLRIVTGGIAGVIMPFFLIPIVNKIQHIRNKNKN